MALVIDDDPEIIDNVDIINSDTVAYSYFVSPETAEVALDYYYDGDIIRPRIDKALNHLICGLLVVIYRLKNQYVMIKYHLQMQ